MASPRNPITRTHKSRYPKGLVAIASIAPVRSGECFAMPRATITAMTPMTM